MAIDTPSQAPTGTTTPSVEASPVPKVVVAFFGALRKILGGAEYSREVMREVPKVSHSGTWKLRVTVEPDDLDGGFVAECLDVPGAMAQGETEEESLENLIDAVQGVVAARMEDHFRSIDFDMEPVDRDRVGRVLSVTF